MSMAIFYSFLNKKLKCKLSVIPCQNYRRNFFYRLPVSPSPNLKTDNAIKLYPSLCLFEGTIVSVGRGTDNPFEMWGFPTSNIKDDNFTPMPNEGSKEPPYNGKKCYGKNLIDNDYREGQLNLSYLIDAYNSCTDKSKFFTPFFTKLAGTTTLQKQIEQGISEEKIRESWKPAIAKFKTIRKKYLLYQDFE